MVHNNPRVQIKHCVVYASPLRRSTTMNFPDAQSEGTKRGKRNTKDKDKDIS